VANPCDPLLLKLGGGAREIQVRHLPPMNDDDPLGHMMVVHLVVDVRDAMGANAVNTMVERLAPELEALTGGRARLRILSNLADRRTVTATGRVPLSMLRPRTNPDNTAVAHGIEEASVFAERDPYRAATHNKGIMNGIDAVLIALGQDWRAIEAGAHAYAARGDHYAAMATWRFDGEYLTGRLEIPMAVGTVGGIVRVHPAVKANVAVAQIDGAADLAALVAAVGLAQNLGALRALADEGIQHGHMRLHARNVAAEAGVALDQVDRVAETIAREGQVNADAALRVAREL
jgi:hydroxymethylglutaryl-CoA reductase